MTSHINNSSEQTTVTMTKNHLLYNNNNELITANKMKIGSLISDNFIVSGIENDKQYSSTPITFSGYLQVNGIRVSSYVHSKELAELSHNFLSIFRWISQNINQQISGKILEQVLKQSSHQRYYEIFKKLFGKEIVENQFWFTTIAIPTVIFILISSLISNPTVLFTICGSTLLMSLMITKKLIIKN